MVSPFYPFRHFPIRHIGRTIYTRSGIVGDKFVQIGDESGHFGKQPIMVMKVFILVKKVSVVVIEVIIPPSFYGRNFQANHNRRHITIQLDVSVANGFL